MISQLLDEIRKCTVCKEHLALGPRPVVSASPESKIMIIGQAPGLAVHTSGIPWDDKSGDNLRRWMDISKTDFYDANKVALVPMGFCYPGKGKSGDLPPRPECAPTWHAPLLKEMKEVKLTLFIGKYAQDYYLTGRTEPSLTETVRNFESFLPSAVVLPHPSPRNNIWQAKHPWFAEQVLPVLKVKVAAALQDSNV